MYKFILIALIFLSVAFGFQDIEAKRIKKEKIYQMEWCIDHNGTIEEVLSDNSRVDCLTKEYAIEFDFDKKWAESIGQALLYSALTGKQPGIVLVVGKNGEVYWDRLNKVIEYYNLPIKTWRVNE